VNQYRSLLPAFPLATSVQRLNPLVHVVTGFIAAGHDGYVNVRDAVAPDRRSVFEADDRVRSVGGRCLRYGANRHCEQRIGWSDNDGTSR
jgi:hypothetical protein